MGKDERQIPKRVVWVKLLHVKGEPDNRYRLMQKESPAFRGGER